MCDLNTEDQRTTVKSAMHTKKIKEKRYDMIIIYF